MGAGPCSCQAEGRRGAVVRRSADIRVLGWPERSRYLKGNAAQERISQSALLQWPPGRTAGPPGWPSAVRGRRSATLGAALPAWGTLGPWPSQTSGPGLELEPPVHLPSQSPGYYGTALRQPAVSRARSARHPLGAGAPESAQGWSVPAPQGATVTPTATRTATAPYWSALSVAALLPAPGGVAPRGAWTDWPGSRSQRAPRRSQAR